MQLRWILKSQKSQERIRFGWYVLKMAGGRRIADCFFRQTSQAITDDDDEDDVSGDMSPLPARLSLLIGLLLNRWPFRYF